jgi:diaminohydroxyphosphoribosylaminopyrimidine deaminase/5-amino-6-(5-phosphoribosylamino)uracil reductase
MTPEEMMRLALAQARRALGRVFPNPAVGAVVVRGERVLGRGFTQPPGGSHAEVVALERAARRHGREALRGGSLAVTLEPCSHRGRTGPCTQALRDARLARLYIGHVDPHPEVSGRGIRQLRRAGLHVRVGGLEAECRDQHRGFVSVQRRGRPFVTLKLAASLDGRIATAAGESRWVTSDSSRAFVHRLRERTDAILIGSSTVLADDPELTARRDGRTVHRPVRVLLDSRLRVPVRARLYRRSDAQRSWVLTRKSVPAARRRAVSATGARLLSLPARSGRVDLRAALARLAHEGLTSVLVEGGGGLAAALVQAGLVDEVHWFVAPKLLGGDGRAALGPLGLGRLARAPRLEVSKLQRHGPDWHFTARLRPGGREG